MTTCRMTKYEQLLLQEIWPGIPAALAVQLAGVSVCDISITQKDVQQAVKAVRRQLADTRCKARTRRLTNLLALLERTM